jgi:hypothetical protein
MTVDEFRTSLTLDQPPPGLPPALLGLWWDGKGDWTRAHDSLQESKEGDGAWVHAYLHRKEGDHSNAAYWYARAKKSACKETLNAEWLTIARDLLQRG